MSDEFEGDVSEVQSASWERVLNPSREERDGQRATWEMAVATDRDRELIVLPTGYGKTDAAVGSFLILKHRGIVDRALWLVPTDALRSQLTGADHQCGAIRSACRDLGFPKIDGVPVDSLPRALNYITKHPNILFFVASYQHVYSDSTFLDITEIGRWMIIYDEAHHLSEGQSWGPVCEERLRRVFTLYMSATPIRTDQQKLIGVPCKSTENGETYDASVEVSLRNAVDEQAVRIPTGHIHSYYIDVVDGDSGTQMRLTTEGLAEEGITDTQRFSEYELRHSLRYCTEYVSDLLERALQTLNSKNLSGPGHVLKPYHGEYLHQMLVFAMSLKHAESIVDVLLKLGETSVDWVGESRNAKQNDRAFKRFNSHNLKILVQVDKASEGFDNKRCSVLVFLHLVKSQTKIAQQIGRGMRRNGLLPFENDRLDIHCGSDTPIAAYVAELEQSVGEFKDRPETNGENEGEVQLFDIPDILVVGAQQYKTDHVMPSGVEVQGSEHQRKFAEKWNIPISAVIQLIEDESAILCSGNRLAATQKDVGESELRQQLAGQVNDAVGTLASNFVRVTNYNGTERRASVIGQVKVNIHKKWKSLSNGIGHSGMSAEQFKAKLDWVRSINDMVRERNEERIPLWLRNSLSQK